MLGVSITGSRLRGTAAALLVSAVFASSAAHAEDPGWYFSFEGFHSQLDDSDAVVTSVIPGTPGGTTPTGCILPNPFTDDQVPPGDLCLIGPPTSPTDPMPGDTVVDDQAFITFKDGFGAAFSLGKMIEGGLRPEFSLSYAENDIETITLFGTTSSPQNGSMKALSLMASAWYDFDFGWDLWPYIGAGLGWTRAEFESGSVKDADGTFGYQAGAGLNFWVSNQTIISLDYRYVIADNLTFETDGNGSNIGTEYRAHRVGLGFKYLFDEAAFKDSDGDGVPDRKDKCPRTPKGVEVYSDGCPVDLDGDGVPDYLDKCPGTPPGVQVNSQGCEIDSDGDGVPDSRDECPGTPRGVRVDPRGCPLDSDGDGVPDYLDKCPGTPAGTKVDESGCPLVDADGDGVPDRQDKCPDTPPDVPVGPDGCPLDSDGDGIPDYLDECPNSPPGAKVLPNGCALKGDCRKPRPGEQVDENGCAVEQRFILRGVKFEFDSDRLLPESKEILNDVAATLQSYPDVAVEVEGHTDDIGTDAYNLGLSERRSNAVKVYLVGRGIPADRMIPVGYGESRPIESNHTEAGREENRRVEFKVQE